MQPLVSFWLCLKAQSLSWHGVCAGSPRSVSGSVPSALVLCSPVWFLDSDPRASICWFFPSGASVPVLVVVWVSSCQGLVHGPWG